MITVNNLLILALLSGSALAQTWPRKVTPSSDLPKYSLSEDQPFSYQTSSYQIDSFKDLDASVLIDFIRCAEAVPAALKALPLPLFHPSKDAKGSIQLFANEALYLEAGGAKNTAGYYDGKEARVLIQWNHFQRSTGENTLKPDPAFDLVIHELTHLGMHRLMWKAEPWFTEGVAEYLAAAHTGKGHFDFTRIDQAIRARVERHHHPDLQKVPLLKISSLLKLTSKDWLERTATLDPWKTLEAYNTSLLLIHYAFHGGMERRNQVRQYLETLEPILDRRVPRPFLFEATEGEKIERALQGYWKTRGLTLEFGS